MQRDERDESGRSQTYELWFTGSRAQPWVVANLGDVKNLEEALAVAKGHGQGRYVICDERGNLAHLHVPSPRTSRIAKSIARRGAWYATGGAMGAQGDKGAA